MTSSTGVRDPAPVKIGDPDLRAADHDEDDRHVHPAEEIDQRCDVLGGRRNRRSYPALGTTFSRDEALCYAQAQHNADRGGNQAPTR
jgi:hypothetical protein